MGFWKDVERWVKRRKKKLVQEYDERDIKDEINRYLTDKAEALRPLVANYLFVQRGKLGPEKLVREVFTYERCEKIAEVGINGLKLLIDKVQ